jgi:hypothetical protein
MSNTKLWKVTLTESHSGKQCYQINDGLSVNTFQYAKLIEAAPDLLEALEESLEYIHDCFSSGFPDHQDVIPNQDEQDLINKIKHAIAKAKGE